MRVSISLAGSTGSIPPKSGTDLPQIDTPDERKIQKQLDGFRPKDRGSVAYKRALYTGADSHTEGIGLIFLPNGSFVLVMVPKFDRLDFAITKHLSPY